MFIGMSGQIKSGMKENRIFDLVLVKYGHILVIYRQFLVKCRRFLEFFGIDVKNGVIGRKAAM